MPRIDGRVLLAVVLACAWCAAPAGAAAPWGPIEPVRVAYAGGPGEPDVRVDARGGVTAVWQEDREVPVIADRPTDGGPWRWTAPFSPVGDTQSIRLATNDAGAGVLVRKTAPYSPDVECGCTLQAVHRTPQGTWSSPVSLPGPLPRLGGDAAVTLDADGRATVLVGTGTGEGGAEPDSILESRRSPGGTWSAWARVPVAPQSSALSSAVAAPDGTLTAAWSRDGRVFTAARAADGPWQPAALAVADLGDARVDLRVNAGGDALLLVSSGSGPDRIATRPAAGSWSAARSVPGVDRVGDVAFDDRGTTTAVWSRDGVRAAVRPLGGGWSPPHLLDASGFDPGVTVDGRGTTTAVWLGADDATSVVGRVRTARRSATGAWSASEDLGPPDRRGAIGVGAGRSGDVATVWVRNGAQDDWSYEARVAPPDRTVPAFTEARISPEIFSSTAAARVGFTLTEAATVTATLESFDRDGAHPYETPAVAALPAGAQAGPLALLTAGKPLPTGFYRLTLTAADAAGNTSPPTTLWGLALPDR